MSLAPQRRSYAQGALIGMVIATIAAVAALLAITGTTVPVLSSLRANTLELLGNRE